MERRWKESEGERERESKTIQYVGFKQKTISVGNVLVG